MALVSQPRRSRPGGGFQYRRYGRRRRAPYVLGGLLVLALLAVAAAVVVVASTGSSLTSDPAALAKVGLPFGGGRIASVSVVTGPRAQPVPVQVRGDRIWPRTTVPAGEQLSIQVVIKRPGWISWLSGSSDHLSLSVVAPSVAVRQSYLTVSGSQPLRLSFDRPVAAVFYGPSATQLSRHVLSAPSAALTLARTSDAGTIWVAATARTWESAQPQAVSWFPAGAVTTAVATPAPGTRIGPSTPITLTFSKSISAALGSSRPPVAPVTPGSWQQVNAHTIVFRPTGYGYGLGATVKVGLPAGVKLVGGQAGGSAEYGSWPVPPGSTLRLQQLLANLGYLPLRFSSSTTVANTPQAQESAAISPPRGTFTWRYGNVPAPLRSMWAPGVSGEMTRGAVMAFENDQGMTADGVAGPDVWRALLTAAVSGHGSGFGYTFVMVDKSSQQLTLWHSGRTVLTTPVNTGIAQDPTASGTFPVFEHIRVGTMSGTNPDGSHYNDPGIQFISYFNGGDALHAFTRAQYGFPQSLGCVEMPLGPAGQVWPYTPIGTLVHVS